MEGLDGAAHIYQQSIEGACHKEGEMSGTDEHAARLAPPYPESLPAPHDTPSSVSHLNLILKTSLQSMATSSRRRLRGTARDNVQLNTLVPQQDKDFVFDLAKRMGLSTGGAMELFIAHLRTEVERDGLPSWFNRSDLPEALPIAKAS